MPLILPTNLKHRLVKVRHGLQSGSLTRQDQIFVKLLFSILSFFRATSPSFSKANFKTITRKFTGSCMFLPEREIRMALMSMGFNSIHAKRINSSRDHFGETPIYKRVPATFGSDRKPLFSSKPSLFLHSTKTGPNSTIAVLGIGLDLIA